MTKTIFLLAAASTALFAVPAAAQDSAASDFTGFRVEGLVGYDSSRPGSKDDIDNADDLDQSIDNVNYGVGVGYDIDLGGVVVGAEGEWMESSAKTDYDTFGFTEFGVANISAGRDLYAGVRVGVPVGSKALIYAKGGYTNAKYNVLATDNTTDTKTDINLDGWRAGAGIQYNLSKNLFVKAEYRYSNYGRGEVEAPSGMESDRFDVDVDRHQGVVGVGVRF
ncbi:MAG: outer membrane beta-barrel protein [Candidatus Andeanibacterium colombiense]|uniref:Outer membrane beta-barrel protein n=1 Tax=Candidatus Andeanibacterium colombiense TaxID=3121345 RepID=A0AAJ6BNE8_9SPHN|nr:MAG: outer membrane beta-barrel protein [Sphingomonadaceae bacterium]